MSSNIERDETNEVNNRIPTTDFDTSHSIPIPQMFENEVNNMFFGLMR